jgi:four helix bundle suffix protein
MDKIIPKHGGYRSLKSFQLAQLVYDITVRFTERFIAPYSRTKDQMVQAARSGVQNIAEGSQASATSKKTEINLTNVARASLEELKLDYEDFLRHRKLPLWDYSDPRRRDLINHRFNTADQFVRWSQKQNVTLEETAANGMIALLVVTCSLLDRQIQSQAEAFKHEGGFTERLYHHRKAYSKQKK